MTETRRRFLLQRCLGKGGFGEVYQATMTSAGGLRSEVAVKLLRSDTAPGSQAMERLRDEAKLLAWLNHPTILSVKDLITLDGRVALVTEYVPGSDLQQCLEGPGAMSQRAVLEVLGQVAGALNVAYNTAAPDTGEPLHLVHRDIKPANIRIGRHGYVKLLDFGIARSEVMGREARTESNILIGSAGYLAPERFTEEEGRSASDVFALGCILYEALAGERFFGRLSMVQVSVFALNPERYAEFLAERTAPIGDVDELVLGLLRDLLAYDPDARPTAAEASHRCEVLAEHVGGATLGRWARDHRWDLDTGAHGPLDGQVVIEGAPATGTLELQRPPPPAPPRKWWLGLAGLGLAATSLLVMLGSGAALWLSSASDRAAPVATTAPTAQPVAIEAPPPEQPSVEEPPLDEPEQLQADEPPTQARPTPRAPAPVAPPEEPTSAPVEAPEPEEAAPGEVRVQVQGDGTVVTELRRDGMVTSAGPVPPGTYELWADFGGGLNRQGDVTVGAGQQRRVRCSTLLWTCELPGG